MTAAKRVYCATFYGETNTFSPLLTGMDDFSPMDLLGPGTPSRERAFAPVIAEGGVVLGRFSRMALPAGPVVRQAYEGLRDSLLLELQEHLPLDLVVLNLHGAMVALGYDDCEGDVLSRLRDLVGPQVVVAVILDPHCHVTQTMIQAASFMVAYREYPHIDEVDTAVQVVRLGWAAACGRVHPRLGVHDCRCIGIYHTFVEPMKGFVLQMRSVEQLPGVLAVSLAHGFPWGDVPDLGTKMLVVTDGDATRAALLATQLGENFESLARSIRLDEQDYRTVLASSASLPGLTVIADIADNPGGGAPGDSTFLLAEALALGLTGVALGPLWDPASVRMAFKAGVGARATLRIGGKTGATSGSPLDLEVRINALLPAYRCRGSGGYAVDYGDIARVTVAGVSIVLTSVREQAMSTSLFTDAFIDLRTLRVVIVKSGQHFRAGFEPIAARILYAQSPGALSTNFCALPYRYARRPLWPLDSRGVA